MTFEQWIAAQGLVLADLGDAEVTKLQAAYEGLKAAGKLPEPRIVDGDDRDDGDGNDGSAPPNPPVEADGKAKPARDRPLDDAGDDQIAAARKRLAAEHRRIAALEAAFAGQHAADGATLGELRAKAIESGWSPERVKTEIELADLRAGRPKGPLAGDGGRGGLTQSVIIAAGCLSCGMSDEKLVKDRDFGEPVVTAALKLGRGFGPQGIIDLAARAAGIQLPHPRYAPKEYWAQLRAEFSTLSLPYILGNVMNKVILDSYTAVDPDTCANAGDLQPAWAKWVRRSIVGDFKPHYRLRLTSDMQFEELGDGGQIKSGKVSEQSYTISADTYAKLFTITRKDIINDDQNALASLPQHFGRGSGLKIVNLVYAALLGNAGSFFHGTHNNLATGSALAIGTLEAAAAKLISQKDPHDKPAGLMPRILLVPPGLSGTARQLYNSEYLIGQLVTSGSANKGVPARNDAAGRYLPVGSQYLADSTLSGYSATSWYLLTDPASGSYVLEAGFLNGQEVPTVEQGETEFDRLGISFRGYVDFGVALSEYRAGVKSNV